jgi:hypothetical protein
VNGAGTVRLRIDPWAAEYDGAAGQLDAEEPAAAVDPKVERADWAAVKPGARQGAAPALLFVDGVRRIDCRFVAEAGDRRGPGLFGSFAVGAARAAAAAEVVKEQVGRVAALPRGVALLPFALRIGGSELGYEPVAAADDEPDAALRALQNAMRRAEAVMAAALAGDGDAVFVDGPLAAALPPGPFVGYVKRLLRSYLPPPLALLLPALSRGERTPLFRVDGAPLPRLSWYLRIGFGSGRAIDTDLAGIVRCECPAALGVAAGAALADLAARELPRFASDALRDPRAPQNLFPIGALEAHLRHRLGDPVLLRRALERHVAGST